MRKSRIPKVIFGICLCMLLLIYSTSFALGNLDAILEQLNQILIEKTHAQMQAMGYSREDYIITLDDDNNVEVTLKEGATPRPTALPTPPKTEIEIMSEQAEAYATGLAMEAIGDWFGATKAFVDSDGYADSLVHIQPYLKAYAVQQMEAGEYFAAQKALQLCKEPSLSDFLAQCNDKCFLMDLAHGLNLRWANASLIANYGDLVGYELDQLEKYRDAVFSDKTLEKYAKIYINGLNIQLTGYGYQMVDIEKYNAYWNDGMNMRMHMLYLINEEYGINVDDKTELRNSVAKGHAIAETTSVDSYDYPGKNAKTTAVSVSTVATPNADKHETAYYKGIQLEGEGDWVGAIDAFVASDGYADAVVHIAPYLEDYVYEKMDSEDYRQAQAALLLCNAPDLNDLLAECNDYCFLLDLADGLSTRFSNEKKDTSVMPDRKVREYYRSLVNDELDHIGKYMNFPFADKKLAEYAFTYFGALQSQLVGAEYYGENDELHVEYWITNGQKIRQRMIYLLNRKYGIEVPPTHAKTFKETLQAGMKEDAIASIDRMFQEQLRVLKLNFRTDSNGSIRSDGFSIRNTSGYYIDFFAINVLCFDKENNLVFEYTFDSGLDFEKNETRQTNHDLLVAYKKDGMPVPEFSRIEIGYKYTSWSGEVDTGDQNGSATPIKQWGWDGKNLRSNDPSANNSVRKQSFALENLTASWNKNDSSSKTLYAPVVKFVLRNTGNMDADRVTVKCVFIDQDTQVEWDEAHVYVASSSTVPLKVDYAREVAIYSDKGYPKRMSNVPNLRAEIYVNDEPVGMIEIER